MIDRISYCDREGNIGAVEFIDTETGESVWDYYNAPQYSDSKEKIEEFERRYEEQERKKYNVSKNVSL